LHCGRAMALSSANLFQKWDFTSFVIEEKLSQVYQNKMAVIQGVLCNNRALLKMRVNSLSSLQLVTIVTGADVYMSFPVPALGNAGPHNDPCGGPVKFIVQRKEKKRKEKKRKEKKKEKRREEKKKEKRKEKGRKENKKEKGREEKKRKENRKEKGREEKKRKEKREKKRKGKKRKKKRKEKGREEKKRK
jgi:hypothetical protein